MRFVHKNRTIWFPYQTACKFLLGTSLKTSQEWPASAWRELLDAFKVFIFERFIIKRKIDQTSIEMIKQKSLSLFLLLSYSKSYESSFLSIYSIQDNLLRILFLPKKIKKHFPFFFFTSLYISFSISNPTRWQQLSLEKKEKSTDQVTGYKSREPSKPLFPKRKESRDCASKIRSENQSVELYVQFEENNSTVRRNVRILMLKFSK